MTEARDGRSDQHLARARVRDADVLDHQRLVDFKQDGGLHRCFLFLLSLQRGLSSPLPRGEVRPKPRLPDGQSRSQAYAAEINSPTSAIPTARSPSRWLVIARCTEFSVSRNGSFPETR